MSQSNFIKFGRNLNTSIVYSGSEQNVLNQTSDTVEIAIPTFDYARITKERFYVFQPVTFICDQNEVFLGRIVNIQTDRFVITFERDISSIVFKRLFFEDYKISSGTYEKEVVVNDIETLGQYYSNGNIYFKTRILLSKPLTAKVYKYNIKYQTDLDSDFVNAGFIDILEKDYKGNDIVQFSATANEYIFFKISAYYKYNNRFDFSLYNDVYKINKQDIEYVSI